MMSSMTQDSLVTATLGFAATKTGSGITYLALRSGNARQATYARVAFGCQPLPALRGRDVAYAAIEAAAAYLLGLGVRRVAFRVDDASVADDVVEHRAVPAALTIPYVRLQCALNRFSAVEVTVVEDRTTRDLGTRARAEVALAVAA